MRRALGFLLVLVCLASLTNAQSKRGPSTPEERERFVAIAHKLEANPLDKTLQSDREWALRWLIEVPDISVSICSQALGPKFFNTKYKYSGEIVGQLTLSQGAFVIEHPDKAQDFIAQYLAGAEGALKAYKAILQTAPKAKSKELDELLAKQANGQLTDFLKETTQKACKN
jgi:hypothetical protein